MPRDLQTWKGWVWLLSPAIVMVVMPRVGKWNRDHYYPLLPFLSPKDYELGFGCLGLLLGLLISLAFGLWWAGPRKIGLGWFIEGIVLGLGVAIVNAILALPGCR